MMARFEINGRLVHGHDKAAERLEAAGVPLHRAETACERLQEGEGRPLFDRDGRFLAYVHKLATPEPGSNRGGDLNVRNVNKPDSYCYPLDHSDARCAVQSCETAIAYAQCGDTGGAMAAIRNAAAFERDWRS